MTHCLQFDKLRFWKSKPIANIPNWKWEGYAEYVCRQNTDQENLSKNIERFIATDEKYWEIKFADSTIAPREYYDYWTLVQYCMDIKKMTYKQILADRTSEQIVRQEMMSWYNSGVVIDELPVRPLDKVMAGAGLLSQIVIDEYVDHLPLYRQMQRFERGGLKLPYATHRGYYWVYQGQH